MNKKIRQGRRKIEICFVCLLCFCGLYGAGSAGQGNCGEHYDGGYYAGEHYEREHYNGDHGNGTEESVGGEKGSSVWKDGSEGIRNQMSTVDSEEISITVPRLYAGSAVLMDGHSGRVLYEKNGYEILPMASTTKIMTCILALENGDSEDVYTVSSYAASMPQVSLGAAEGEQYRLKDLLYSLMLESHNDTAVVIAEGIAGSVEAFADMMNQKARDIGAYDTFFVTPNGLDETVFHQGEEGETIERSHSTTAVDLARILGYCINTSEEREAFLEITRTASYCFSDQTGQRNFVCTNHNTFLNMMDGVLTGKTGYTSKAGYCYVGAVEQEGEQYIVALLACGWPGNKTYKWSDMKTLVKYGLENYEYRDVWREPAVLRVPVTDGALAEGDPEDVVMVPLCVRENEDGRDPGRLPLLLRKDETVRIRIDCADAIPAPAEAGTAAGSIRYLLEGQMIACYDLVTAEAVEKKDFYWYLQWIRQEFFKTKLW